MTLKRYIGNKSFYKMVLGIAVPIMVQSGITNFVSLLDNIMVGRLGTEAMSGISIVNQFIFIFYLAIFGAISAAGIFTAQYHGLGDAEGVRYTFRFKLLINLVAGVAGIAIFVLFGKELISLFLHAGSAEGDLALTLEKGREYLTVMLIGLLPYALAQVYASTLRETGQTVVPMVASILAVAVNFVLNCVLIFGMLGAPALGVVGAAIATVISRFVELGVLVIWTHVHRARCAFIVGAYRSLLLPRKLFFQIVQKGLPLMANEVLWAVAMTMRNQCYSTRGLEVVAAQNISTTVVNVLEVVYMAIGSAIAIIVGNQLGAGKLEEAKDTDRKMMTFAVFCGALMSLFVLLAAPFFPRIYEVSGDARGLATYMMLVSALIMPFAAFAHAAYFTLRSGGKVLITLLFDSVYMWCFVIPVVAILAYGTELNIHWVFLCGQATEIIKVFFGAILLRRGTWVRQLVSDQSLKQ